MRNHLRSLIAAVLVLALLLLSGCSGAAPIDTSLPTTIPVEPSVSNTISPSDISTTESPTEPAAEPDTTIPETISIDLDETVTMPPHDWKRENIEEEFGVESYVSPACFLLKDPGLQIGFPDSSAVTLNLPESWAGKYYVLESIHGSHAGGYDSSNRVWHILIVSKKVLQAYWKVNNFRNIDCALVLSRMWIESYESELKYLEEQGRQMARTVVAQDDEFVYYIATAETSDIDVMDIRQQLISKIGEEAYLEAQGDITCTLEEAVAMCSVD